MFVFLRKYFLLILNVKYVGFPLLRMYFIFKYPVITVR